MSTPSTANPNPTPSTASQERQPNWFDSGWGKGFAALLTIVGLAVSIALPLTLGRDTSQNYGSQKYGGGDCRKHEDCRSGRCDLASSLCLCTNEKGESFCADPAYQCGMDTIECQLTPSAAPTCASSFVIGEEHKMLATDATVDSNFGGSVSVDGSTAVIGAYTDRSAYIFEGSGHEWTELIKLEDASSVYFGSSVAIDGDTIIIGASGSAHVYQNSGSNKWDFLTNLEADGVSPGDNFGMAVALDRDTVIVGARGDDKTSSGSAYIFVRNGSDWAFQDKISGNDGSPGDRFGQRVSLHGDMAIVGSNSGAYIFSRTGSDWKFKTKLTPKDAPAEYNSFYTVALNEDTAVLGALGSSYIFSLSGSEWAQRKKIPEIDLPSTVPTSVALDGDTLIIGRAGNDSTFAYAYVRVGFDWKEAGEFNVPSGADNLFGYSVDVDESENVVIIGAPGLPGKQGSFYPSDFSDCV